MRLLIINTLPIWGGDEKWVINLGKGIKDRGHFVVIASPKKSETFKKTNLNGLSAFPLTIGPDIAVWKIPSIIEAIKKNNIDTVLCVQNRDVKIGALAAKIAGVKVIFARQGLDTMKNSFGHKMVFTNLIDGLIVNTKSLKTLYDGYGWFSEEFVKVVYDGLTLPESIPTIDLHKQFKLKKASKVIIGTGRLAKQKRFDLLIKVAVKAKKNSKNWSIIVAGTGDLEKNLNAEAKKNAVDHMIKFIGFTDDVLSLMKSSDLFVLSSDSEGMSNALREAMAVGLPCVSTDVYGVEELFGDNENGIMVKRGDYESIYLAINSIFNNSELDNRLSMNAAELIKSSFTMSRMIDQVVELLQGH
jgi:glycosyltransferase involved in cell wall biosynthesis